MIQRVTFTLDRLDTETTTRSPPIKPSIIQSYPLLSSPPELPRCVGGCDGDGVSLAKRSTGRRFLLRLFPVVETARSFDGILFSHGAGTLAHHSLRLSRAGKRSAELLLSLGRQLGAGGQGRLRNRRHHLTLSNGKGF